MKYLVTGATGNIGSLVVQRLLERGVRPRVFVRDADKARKLYGDRVDIAVGDLTDMASLGAALDGVVACMLVNSGPELAAQDEAAAKVALAAGTVRLVKLSSMDVAEQVGTGVWHARGEAAIRSSGVEFSFVRPGGFMSNALYWAHSIKREGVVRSSTGDGKIAFIHPDDIAAVVVEALTTRSYVGAVLPISGPEALSYAEMTATIGEAIGERLRYEAISEEAGRQQQLATGAVAEMAEARVSIFRAIREGRLTSVSDVVERVLGRKPMTFGRWAKDNAAAFR